MARAKFVGVPSALLRSQRDAATYKNTQWRPIPGFPGYEASRCGKIARVSPAKTHPVPRILKTQINESGYARCKILQNNKKTCKLLHRLVLLAWKGPPPKDKLLGCHNDGNPKNNAIENLRWDDCAGNFADKVKHGTDHSADRNGRAKMTWKKVREMREKYANGASMLSLSREYDLAPSQTREICKKESWWPDVEQSL